MMRSFLFVVLCLFSVAWGQVSLVLNGHRLDDVTTSLVNGFTYIPANSIARVFKGQSVEDGAAVTLTLLGHSLRFEIADSPAEAVQISGALYFDGQLKASTAAVRSGGTVFIPLRHVMEVLGGNIDYLAGQIVAITPRASVSSAQLTTSSSSERIIINLSSAISYTVDYDRSQNRVRFFLDQTDIAKPWQSSGRFVNSARLTLTDAKPELTLELAQGMTYASFVSDEVTGFKLVVDVFPETQTSTDTSVEIMFDNASRDAATVLTEQLKTTSLVVSSSFFTELKTRLDSSMLIVLSQADIPVNSFNVYYPQENQDTRVLQLASQNTLPPAGLEDVFDSFQTNYNLMAQNAERLARTLSALTSYEGTPVSAPLAHTGHLADTVVILELNSATLADPVFMGQLGAVILSLLGER